MTIAFSFPYFFSTQVLHKIKAEEVDDAKESELNSFGTEKIEDRNGKIPIPGCVGQVEDERSGNNQSHRQNRTKCLRITKIIFLLDYSPTLTYT